MKIIINWTETTTHTAEFEIEPATLLSDGSEGYDMVEELLDAVAESPTVVDVLEREVTSFRDVTEITADAP